MEESASRSGRRTRIFETASSPASRRSRPPCRELPEPACQITARPFATPDSALDAHTDSLCPARPPPASGQPAGLAPQPGQHLYSPSLPPATPVVARQQLNERFLVANTCEEFIFEHAPPIQFTRREVGMNTFGHYEELRGMQKSPSLHAARYKRVGVERTENKRG